MPIPDFDLNLVLPPHLGNPTRPAELSPYPCTSVELCQRFATSPERVKILKGFLALRQQLRSHGMEYGFQWLDGSFLENIEVSESRHPNDVDVVTFYINKDPNFALTFFSVFPAIVDRAKIKEDYRVDHYIVDMAFHPEVTVESARYWCGLFSHSRKGVWKGMLRVELNTPSEDAAALSLLAQRGSPEGTEE